MAIESDQDKTLWLSPLVLGRGFLVQFREDHVHVQLGKGFSEDSKKPFDLWNELRRICLENNSRRVLVEGTLPQGGRSTSDVIEAGQRTSNISDLWLAFHLDNFVPDEQSELYIVIAASHGVRVRFFNNREHALAWLKSNTES